MKVTYVYVVGVDIIRAGVCKQRVELDSMSIIWKAQKDDLGFTYYLITSPIYFVKILAFINTKTDLRSSKQSQIKWSLGYEEREKDMTCSKDPWPVPD